MTKELLKRFQTTSAKIYSLKKQMDIFTKSGVQPIDPDEIPKYLVLCDEATVLQIELADLKERLSYELIQYMKMKPEVEAFIDCIDNGHIRAIARLKLLYGYSWRKVANAMGIEKDTARIFYSSYLKKHGTNMKINEAEADEVEAEAHETAED